MNIRSNESVLDILMVRRKASSQLVKAKNSINLLQNNGGLVKLDKLYAEDVYGYLRFDIDFNNKVSFLVGANGKGKTTALKLLQALLAPSIRDLLNIPHSYIRLSLTDNEESHVIISKKVDDFIEISTTYVEDVLKLPKEFEYLRMGEPAHDSAFDKLQIKYSEHPVISAISRIGAPVFLGLDRRQLSDRDILANVLLRENMEINISDRSGAKRVVKGSLAIGLMETQGLIQQAYKNTRQLEDGLAEQLRKNILLSTFKYSEYNALTEGDQSKIPSWMEQKEKFLKRKKEISNVLNNIGFSKEEANSVLEGFFGRLEELSPFTKEKEETANLKRILNKVQIDRITEIITIIDKHKSEVEKLNQPITYFIETVNDFYKDSDKSISIDTVGHLTVHRPDKESTTIDALSSGERQILIIFAHILFNQYGTRSNVYVIDEPELSLHLRWQEEFVDRIKTLNTDAQFILATHSPEIVGGSEDDCIYI